MNTKLDLIVVGHNSFFGVDHLSAEKGREKDSKFSAVDKIGEILRLSRQEGATAMMMSTHARAQPLCELIMADSSLRDLNIYPLLPYAQKYVVAANEKGMVPAVLDILKGTSSLEKLQMAWKGVAGYLSKDLCSLLENLMRIELKIFKGMNVKAVFLHDAFTDLILALGLKDIALFYVEAVPKICGAEAAFSTKNLPRFLSTFASWGIVNPIIMPHVNKLGFWMSPSQKENESALMQADARIMAMNTLAAGRIPPAEAFEYLSQFPSIQSVVVGASTPRHIHETFSAIKQYLGDKKHV